jgi:diguanylate cyclase
MELAEANRHLESLAHQDGLTQLANRRAADMLLEKELAHHRRNSRPLAVLLADIDHFKRVNDAHGHAVGDDVLKAVALRIGEVLRLGDVAARFGGEEFLVILKETDEDGAATAAEKLREAIESMVLPVVGRLTMSFGAAVARNGAELSSVLLKRADDALYRAKAAGRNRVVMAESGRVPDLASSGL